MAGSSASGSSSASQAPGESGLRKSPIPYRTRPLEYQPPMFCYCGKKAALWISWSDDNPGRRYLKCYRARDGGCSYLDWYEGPSDPFVCSLLRDLRDAVWSTKRDRAELKVALTDAEVVIERQKQGMLKALDEVERQKEQVKVVEVQLKKMKKERVVLYVLCVALAVLLLRANVV
ncbi:hypothetical protein U9M48_001711 [Paspalum notatum var. saurae]|uniref:GRF-type domain-containing protein n=1 Tax=Paspalum notatum var. saurae TaxID=547442 RepID=A0AAQ3SJ82_PASNO